VRHKNIFILLIIFLLLFSAYNCKKENAVKKSVLLVGTSANYPPFEYIDENNDYIGFDVDLIKLVALKAGFDEITFVNMGYEDILPSLNEKKIDLAAACISITPERSKLADSVEYFTTSHCIMVKKDKDYEPKSINELSGKRIGVEKGTIGEEELDFAVLDKTLIDAAISRYTSMDTAMMDFDNDLLDALIVEGEYGKYFASKGNYRISMEFHTESIGFFVRKGNKVLLEKIQNALETVKNTSDWNNLIEKYLVKKS